MFLGIYSVQCLTNIVKLSCTLLRFGMFNETEVTKWPLARHLFPYWRSVVISYVELFTGSSNSCWDSPLFNIHPLFYRIWSQIHGERSTYIAWVDEKMNESASSWTSENTQSIPWLLMLKIVVPLPFVCVVFVFLVSRKALTTTLQIRLIHLLWITRRCWHFKTKLNKFCVDVVTVIYSEQIVW